MAEYVVYFQTHASQPIIVNLDLDPGMDRDEARQQIEDAGYEKLHTTLCHQCASHVDLGDFEPNAKIDGFDADED